MSSFALSDGYHLFDTLRRSFLLVTPNETSFSTIEETPDYLVEGSLCLMLMIITEAFLILAKTGTYRLNHSITSGSSFIILQVTNGILIRPIALMVYTWFYNHFCLVDLPWDSPWTWFLMLFGYDFCFYWVHRAGHEVNFLWAIHQNHHSSEVQNLSTTLRGSLFTDYYACFFYLPLALFMRPSLYYMHYNLDQLAGGIFPHMNLIPKLGPLDWFFNTPSNHRVHHARNRYCIDRNYSGKFLIWDHLFGTYQPEKDGEELHYGLVHPIKSFDPWEVEFCHFKHIARTFWHMEGWRNKLSVIFKGPGWAPGKPRLGAPEDISELPLRRSIVHDPKVSGWAQAYACTQYFITLILISTLIDHRKDWPTSLLVIGVLATLAAVTSIAKIFDSKNSAWRFEFLRCVITTISIFVWRSLHCNLDVKDDSQSILLPIAHLHLFFAVSVGFCLFGIGVLNSKSTNLAIQKALKKNGGDCSYMYTDSQRISNQILDVSYHEGDHAKSD